MLDSIITFNSDGGITLLSLVLCTLASVVMGVLIALVYMYRNPSYNRNFVITLALLPAIVQLIIMMVNGNIGTGVAVLGAFSLIRFRSVPGNSRDIGNIFFAMAIGIAAGMGYIAAAAIFMVAIGGVYLLLVKLKFGEMPKKRSELTVIIPEDLEYNDVFDEVFEKYAKNFELKNVKTTNMGSMFKLTYEVELKNDADEKKFIDEIRCRNGNLSVSMGYVQNIAATEL